jgi:hypothetical protein
MAGSARAWTIYLNKPLRVPYGTKILGRTRTAEPGPYEMRKYGRGYRLVASGMGFFDQTRAQIDALIAAGDLRITEGDWAP